MSGDTKAYSRRVRRDTVANLGKIVLGLAIVALIVLGGITLGHVDELTGHIAKAQQSHEGTIAALAKNQKTEIKNQHLELRNQQLEEANQQLLLVNQKSGHDLLMTVETLVSSVEQEQSTEAAGSATVSQILVEAGQAVKTLEQQGIITIGQGAAICAAVHAECPAS